MIKDAIIKIVNKEDLTYGEAYEVMDEILSGQTTPTQNAAFLAALSTKSARVETKDEIAGCASAMSKHSIKVEAEGRLFDIVGTGGDNAHSFNISTAAKRNAVLLNAGASLYLGGKAESIKDGVALAADLIDSGRAYETLKRFIEISNREVL